MITVDLRLALRADGTERQRIEVSRSLKHNICITSYHNKIKQTNI